jgi:hypothetical protein
MHREFVVVFDNGGGTTLQVGKRGFVHHYDDPVQAARDVKTLLDGATTTDWDGHEPLHRIEYNYDVERNGGYHWHDRSHVKQVLARGTLKPGNNGWGSRNVESFYDALGVKVGDWD